MGFFDKLRGADNKPAPKEVNFKESERRKEKKRKTTRVRPVRKTAPQAQEPAPVAEKKEIKINEEEIKEPAVPKGDESDFEGELAIDVYETDDNFVIQSTIAGIKPEDLDITIENDIATIKGSRTKKTSEEAKKYYYQECYWGAFSRQVILPEEVDGSKAEASIKDGVLTLKIPKAQKIKRRKIAIKQED